jgi:hypothetical protein
MRIADAWLTGKDSEGWRIRKDGDGSWRENTSLRSIYGADNPAELRIFPKKRCYRSAVSNGWRYFNA